MGGAASAQRPTAAASKASAGEAAPRGASICDDEASALRALEHIADGSWCLAGGQHCWHEHEGQHGTGRACERCYLTQDFRSKQVVFKIQPHCQPSPSAEPPTASEILACWRTELQRVQAGGCLAGGDHSWVDVRKTLVRLTGEGRCCEKCGVVESCVDGSEHGRILCLPNLMGHFGPQVSKEYREVYGGGRVEVPRGADIIRLGIED